LTAVCNGKSICSCIIFIETSSFFEYYTCPVLP
jgi:hypothetical protein